MGVSFPEEYCTLERSENLTQWEKIIQIFSKRGFRPDVLLQERLK